MASLMLSKDSQVPTQGILMRPLIQPTSVKALAESPNLTTVPAIYTSTKSSHVQVAADPEISLTVIDYSLLVNGTPEQRSKIICDIGKACKEWGFFMVVNHGVPEGLMKGMMDACQEFFDLKEEEKNEYEGKSTLDPIKYGTSFNTSLEKVFLCWRDYLRVIVHPEFHSPSKPSSFSELGSEFSKRSREMARELLKAISESLELEASYIEKAMNMEEEGLQILAANLYPPCPQPDLAMGLPLHSDHGLLTLLIQNGIDGLQLQHKGKWLNVNAIPNSFLVNTADQLEILSNGKYKSLIHRAAVNNKDARISLAIPNGRSLDTVVSPAKELVEREGVSPAYIGITYRDYMQLQLSNQHDKISCLDRVRVRIPEDIL